MYPDGFLGCILAIFFYLSKCGLERLCVLLRWGACLWGSLFFPISWCWCLLLCPFLSLRLRLSFLPGLCFPMCVFSLPSLGLLSSFYFFSTQIWFCRWGGPIAVVVCIRWCLQRCVSFFLAPLGSQLLH